MIRRQAKITNSITLPDFKGVLWDMDGTLVDSEPLHTQSALRLHDELGYPLSRDLFEATTGIGFEGTFEILQQKLRMPITFENWLARNMALYIQLSDNLQPRGNAVDIVRSLHTRGIKQAVVSASHRPVVEANVKAFLKHFDNPQEIFETVITANDVTLTKPDPEGYLLAARRCGVSPQECLIIEDSPTGVKAGKAAGCFTIFWPQQHFNTVTNADLEIAELDFLVKNHSR